MKMNFKLGLTVCMIFCFTQLKFIWSARNFDLNIAPSLDDMFEQEIELDLNIRSCSSNDQSSGNAKLKIESSSSNNCKKKFLKYGVNTHAINPSINETMAKKLKYWEGKLLDKGENSIWENFENLTEEHAQQLCIKLWNKQVQEISKIVVKEGTKTDCDINIIFGPSSPDINNRCYKGMYQYLDIFGVFYPDLVRCNCAVLKNCNGVLRTEKNSKRYFFLYKYTDKVYYVLTVFGALLSRELKIVNVHEVD